MQKIFFVLLLATIITAAHAQAPYNHAIGLKFPGGFSLTYKKFVSDTRNLEGQATVWHKGFRAAGLYEFNFFTFDKVPELSWFIGPGAHLGFWKSEFKDSYGSQIDLGVDGIIGLDYKFKDAPINVSVDWQPAVTLIGSAGFTPVFGGVAIRYTF
jgi:hypothetical protein